MKISPVPLQQLMFKRVHVALDERHMPVHGGAPWSHVALFEGVNIATGFGIDTLAIDAEPGLHYMVSLQVQVDNVAVLEANDQRFFGEYVTITTKRSDIGDDLFRERIRWEIIFHMPEAFFDLLFIR